MSYQIFCEFSKINFLSHMTLKKHVVHIDIFYRQIEMVYKYFGA